MDSSIYELLRKITPFPLLINHTDVLEGNLAARPLKCQNCSNKECLNSNFDKKYCSQGFRVYDLHLEKDSCKFIGVLTSLSKRYLPLALQKKYASKIFDEKSFDNWASHIKEAVLFVQQTINQKQQEYIDGFHDITPTISSIIRNAEQVINLSGGDSLEEKFEHSPENIQTIYKSASLLKHHLDFMGYVSNPDSIKYGQKYSSAIYKFVDMLCRISKQETAKRHVKLRIKGVSYNKPKVYNSFSTLIFILLDNAIKYSYPNQDIIITVQDMPNNGVSIDFMSYGPIVPDHEIENIFKKHYRYIHPSLNSDKIKGHGFGLYMAKLIAHQHGFEIKYSSSPSTIQKNGAQIGENHFSFEISSDVAD